MLSIGAITTNEISVDANNMVSLKLAAKKIRSTTAGRQRNMSACLTSTDISDYHIRPSTAFFSSGRNPIAVQNDTLSLSYYPKKHEHQMNSLSILAYRDKTLKTKGISHPDDNNVKKFELLEESRKDVFSEIMKTEKTSLEVPLTSQVQLKQNRK